MQASGYLHLAGIIFTFSIRIAVAWILCAIIARLLRRPNHRFLVWFSFCVGSALYWFDAMGSGLRHHAASQTHALSLPWRQVLVPAEWTDAVAAAGLFFACLYLGVVMFLFCARIWNHRRLRALLSLGTPASAPFNAALGLLCRELGVKRCELVVLPEITSPSIVCWWNPRLLVPEMCHQLERLPEFTHVMRHELVHVVRRDYLVSTVADVIATILFFHPAVWAARRQMRLERELACDLAVVNACPEHRADYAGSLTSLARLKLTNQRRLPGVGFSSPTSFLATRVRFILLAPQAASRARQLCLSGAAIATFAVLATFAPWLSLSIDMAQDEHSQLAALWSPVTMQHMKHHVRSSFIAPVGTSNSQK